MRRRHQRLLVYTLPNCVLKFFTFFILLLQDIKVNNQKFLIYVVNLYFLKLGWSISIFDQKTWSHAPFKHERKIHILENLKTFWVKPGSLLPGETDIFWPWIGPIPTGITFSGDELSNYHTPASCSSKSLGEGCLGELNNILVVLKTTNS